MKRVLYLYRSSVGKKVVMALTGLFVVGWLFGHMTGNLKVFLGRDDTGAYAIDHYAEWLRELGAPVLPDYVGLWAVRILLAGAILLHILAAWQLTMQSRKARSASNEKTDNSLSFSYASRTMRWGGVLVLLYIIYHLAHFTFGTAHPDFVYGDVYNNLVIGFQNPIVVAVYLIANLALGLHLYHGLWSLTQTLGLNHPRFNHLRRPIAAGLTVVLIGGFLSVPLAVITGVIS